MPVLRAYVTEIAILTKRTRLVPTVRHLPVVATDCARVAKPTKTVPETVILSAAMERAIVMKTVAAARLIVEIHLFQKYRVKRVETISTTIVTIILTAPIVTALTVLTARVHKKVKVVPITASAVQADVILTKDIAYSFCFLIPRTSNTTCGGVGCEGRLRPFRFRAKFYQERNLPYRIPR